jgi:hypothetical protein
MVHFRLQGSSLEDSLASTVTVQTRAELVAYLRRTLAPLPVRDRHLRVRYYAFDERINAPSFIVTLRGEAVGFTDGRL